MTNAGDRTGRKILPATPWYHGWNVIAVCILFQAVTIGLIFYCFSFWIVPFQEEFGADISTVLLAGTLAHIAIGLISAVAGRWFDTGSIRWLVFGGITAFCIGFFLLSWTTALWQVLLLYASLLAIGGTFAGSLPAQVLASRWFEHQRGRALGIVALGTSLGGFMFPPLAAGMIEAQGWRTANQVLAIGSAAVLLPLVVWIVRDGGPDESRSAATSEKTEDSSSSAGERDLSMLKILGDRNALVLLVWFLSLTFLFSGFQINLAPIAAELAIGPQRAAVLMSIISVAMIAGKLGFGALADRLDHRLLLWAATGFMVIANAVLLIAGGFASMLVGVVILGLSGGGFLPLLAAAVAHVFGPHVIGRVIGILSPFFVLAALGPITVGLIRDQSGGYEASFLFAMGLMVVPAVAVWFFDGRGGATARVQ